MTRRVSVLNHTTALDSGVYFSKLNSEMTLTNAKQQMCLVIPDPSADIGVEVIFEVPQDYSSTPVLVIKGVLDGTPASEMSVVLSPTDLPYELSNNHLILLLEATYSSAYGTLSVAKEIEVTVKQRRN